MYLNNPGILLQLHLSPEIDPSVLQAISVASRAATVKKLPHYKAADEILSRPVLVHLTHSHKLVWATAKLPIATMAASLTFPRPTFAKLSPHPFLTANLLPTSNDAAPSRTNGRAPQQARTPYINTSSLSHAHGSAIVRVGDTTVICGVRGEVLPVASIPQWRPKSRMDDSEQSPEEKRRDGARELKDYDLLVPNIELATGCAPQFLPGVPPTTLAQTLSTRVYSLLHGAELLGAEDLRIYYTPERMEAQDDAPMGGDDEEEEGDTPEPELKAFWTLYIDILFISFDGNPFDAAWAAIVAALRDTKLPQAWWDADREMVVCSRKEKKALSINGLPIACSAVILTEKEQEKASQGKSWLLVDPDRLEETLCDETITVVVDRSSGETRIQGMSKGGGTAIGPKEIRQFAGLAESRWEDFKKAMK